MKIDSYSKKIIDSLSCKELEEFNQKIIKECFKKCITIWEEEGVSLNDVERFSVYYEYNIEFKKQEHFLSNRIANICWILNHQIINRREIGGKIYDLSGKQIFLLRCLKEFAIEKIIKEYKKKKQKEARRINTKRIIAESEGCEICGYSFKPILVVHHIIPVAKGGSGEDSNLIVLCPNCHALTHKFRKVREKFSSFCDFVDDFCGSIRNKEKYMQKWNLLEKIIDRARTRAKGK